MTRRTYRDEPYLRSEHLLRDGKYVSCIVEIGDIVYDCPGKKGDKDKLMLGLAFQGTNKVLGLNVTNESVLCIDTGHGKPEQWIGHKIMLVVRLIPNKRKKLREPAIRIWTKKPIPNGRILDQMGEEITDSWYASNQPKSEETT